MDAQPSSDLVRVIARVKIIARTALGLVWCLEGLLPKILFPSPGELALVDRSSLWIASPAATLAGLGVCEVLAGVWLLSGVFERAAALTTTVAMVGLVVVVTANDPSALVNPLGGITKNLGLVACALTVWILSDEQSRG